MQRVYLILIFYCSFGVVGAQPLVVPTPLLPGKSADASLQVTTNGPVLKMEPLTQLQVRYYLPCHTSSVDCNQKRCGYIVFCVLDTDSHVLCRRWVDGKDAILTNMERNTGTE